MQRYRSISMLFPFAAAVAAGCAMPGESTPETTGTTKQDVRITPPAMEGAAFLGTGYAVENQKFTGKCLTGTVQYAGVPQADTGLVLVDNYNTLKQDLGISISGSATFATWQLNAAARFAMSTQETTSSQSLTYAYRVRGKNAVLTSGQPTPEALAARAIDDEAVKKACGTEFVEQVELGAGLWVNVKFDFLDQSVKSDFSAELKLRVMAIFEAQGNVELKYDRLTQSTNVSLSAYQIGGDPTKLSQIFSDTKCQNGGGTEGGVAKSCTAATSCSLANPRACNEAMAGVLTYARDNFPTQLADLKYDVSSPTGAAVLAYVTKGYKEAGYYNVLNQDSPLVAVAVKSARDSLYDRLMRLVRDKNRVSTLLGPTFRLSIDEEKYYSDVDRRIQEQINHVVDTANVCYSKISECTTAHTAMTTELAKDQYQYNPESLIKAPRFFEYCATQQPTEDTKKTLAAIRDQLGARDESCEEVSNQLDGETVLDLHGQALVDVRPLRGAKQLAYLDLSGNSVTNISALSTLPALKVLNIRENQVRNISPISALPNLTKLIASYNKIVDVEPLTVSPKLETLKIQGNPIEDYSPLARIPTLKTVITNDNDVCKVERDEVLAAGMITASEHKIYTNRNWGPDYNRVGDRTSGINGWFPCARVVKTLPAGN